MTRPIRILIVDDHPIFRDGIAFMLASQTDLLCVGQAETPAAAAAAFGALAPDVTLMDLRLGRSDGSSGVRAILKIDPAARLIILTTSESEADKARLLTLGASAYILKSMTTTQLLQTIRDVHAGRRLAADPADSQERTALSRSELRMLDLMRDGRGITEMAVALSISEATVNSRCNAIVDKLGADDRVHAIVIALRRGLIHP